MKLLSLCLLVLVSGCSGAVVDAPEEPCPVVDCGWVDDPITFIQSCPSPYLQSSTKRFEILDEGASACWFYEDTCRAPTWGPTAPVPAECPVQDCKRTHVDCQPNH